MARDPSHTLFNPIRRLLGGEGGSALADAELLEKFATTGDAAAFEVLVWRHGGMVLNLCRRVLRDHHEAEDAFQATFLVFARKARSIGRRDAVGCWLYRVAYRIALRLRAAAGKRPVATGSPAADLPAPATEDADWRDLRPVLDEEIARLPEKYRAPFVLCYLEGRTNEEAAVQLGCPKGTVLSRLARGREWLRTRLTRRGIALSVAGLTILSHNAASAAVPASLTRSTINAALPFAAGKAANAVVSATVAALTEGALRTMILVKVKVATIALVSLAVLGSGITWAARDYGSATPATDTAAVAPPVAGLSPANAPKPSPDAAATTTPSLPTAVVAETETEDQPERGRSEQKPTTNGTVVAIAKDGKSFTVEIPAKGRGEEPARQEFKLTPKTAIAYNGVAENGAKLTEGYRAQVQLENGSKDAAHAVTFFGDAGDKRGPDFSGEVTAIAKDGRGITIAVRGERGKERGVESKKETIPFDDKTVIVFGNVAAGQAKLTEGYIASVWLSDDGKTAGQVMLQGTAGGAGRRDEKRPELSGRVVAAVEGKSITVAIPAGRGEEPTRHEIKLGNKTAVIFNNVVADGTKIIEGYSASVWLEDGAQDTAAKVIVSSKVPERWTAVTGKVVEITAIEKDGFTVVLEQPAAVRGEEATRRKIKIPSTKTAYYGVGPDEAKPTVGDGARIRLRDGSTDTAAHADFFKSTPESEKGRR